MTRSIPAMLCVSSLLFFLTGCALFEYLDGSPPDTIKRIRMSKDEVWNRMEALEADKAALKADKAALKAEKVALKQEIDRARAQNRSISDSYRRQVQDLQVSNETLKQSIDRLERDKRQQVSRKGMTSVAPRAKSDAGTQQVKIKVLSGTGKLISAVNCAKQLKWQGYCVDRTDLAPRADFSRDIVFFARGSQDEGKRLAAILGSNPTVKPLSWQSIFDIIIVAGPK